MIVIVAVSGTLILGPPARWLHVKLVEMVHDEDDALPTAGVKRVWEALDMVGLDRDLDARSAKRHCADGLEIWAFPPPRRKVRKVQTRSEIVYLVIGNAESIGRMMLRGLSVDGFTPELSLGHAA